MDRVPERAAGRYDRHAGGEALFGGDRRIAGREGRVGFPAFVGGKISAVSEGMRKSWKACPGA